jgi:hypothetical protein
MFKAGYNQQMYVSMELLCYTISEKTIQVFKNKYYFEVK